MIFLNGQRPVSFGHLGSYACMC